jgi:DNA-binding HxlR family transcriptional regulator
MFSQEGTFMSEGNTRVILKDHNEESCAPVREVLSCVGDKWSVLIISILENGPLRFNELRRCINSISQRMLARTLRLLERNGLMLRSVEQTVPPSVYYELTPLGKTLLETVQALVIWARVNHPKISVAQKKYDKKYAKLSY